MKWTLQTVIGADESAGLDMLFTRPGAIAFVDDTTFVVADGGEENVRFFDVRGMLLRVTGRKGRGPGEFTLPGYIYVDSIVHVFDPLQQREVVYSKSGEHLATRRVPNVDVFSLTWLVPLSADLRVGATLARQRSEPPYDQSTILILSLHDGGGIVDTLGRFHSGVAPWRSASGAFGALPTRFGPGGAAAVRDSMLVLVDGYAGHASFYVARSDSLYLTREWSLGVTGRSVTKAEASALADEFAGKGTSARGRRLTGIELQPPPKWSVAQTVLVESDGTVWILSEVLMPDDERNKLMPSADGAERWTVFSPTGERREAQLPRRFHLFDVRRGLAVGSYRDEGGVQTVRVYRTQ